MDEQDNRESDEEAMRRNSESRDEYIADVPKKELDSWDRHTDGDYLHLNSGVY